MGIGLFPFHKRDDQVRVVIVSVSCCVPGAKAFEQQTRSVVEKAISETGVNTRVTIMPAPTAYFGGAPRAVMAKMMADSERGQLKVPAVLIDGQDLFYGVPEIEEFKSALLQAATARKAKEEHVHG